MALEGCGRVRVAMQKPSAPRSHDTASWALLAIMAALCSLALRGQHFIVDAAHAVLPTFGLLALGAGCLVGARRANVRLHVGAVAFLQMTLFTLLGVVLTYALAAHAGPPWDARLASADLRLGLNWPYLFRLADRAPALLWLGGIAYQSLIAQMILCIVVLALTGRHDALRTAVLAAILSGLMTVLLSGLIPAFGNLFDPAAFHNLPASIAWQERDLIAGLRDGSGRVLDFHRLMGIVSFPSYHAALPVILAWALREIRVLRLAAPIWAALTIAATPIFGGHYGVDVLGGIALALLAITVASRCGCWTLPRGARTRQPTIREIHARAAAKPRTVRGAAEG